MTPGATPTLPCSGIFGIPDPYPDSVRVAEVDDQRRMAAILAYDAVRMPPRAELQGVVELAARIAGVPKATVNIITDTEQHQIATTGFEGSVSPGETRCARRSSARPSRSWSPTHPGTPGSPATRP